MRRLPIWIGSFSYLAATENYIGFAKDPFAFKPLLFTETDDYVAVATEEIAIRAAFGDGYEVREAQAKDVSYMADIICDGKTTRDINAEIKRLIANW